MTISKREQLINTAWSMFCRNGYHATGIDKIVAESGVAKMTLYSHFKSKEELILAALRMQDAQSRNALMREVEKRAKKPREQLLVMFDLLDEWFHDETFHGCAFINAVAEYADHEDPIHRAAREYKQLVLDYIRALCEKAGARAPKALAQQLFMLMEGAIVMAQVMNQRTAAREGRQAAQILINAAVDNTARQP